MKARKKHTRPKTLKKSHLLMIERQDREASEDTRRFIYRKIFACLRDLRFQLLRDAIFFQRNIFFTGTAVQNYEQLPQNRWSLYSSFVVEL
ncbi:MAG: hypothetical protein WCF65_04390 [Parachlamydiaceae bacterium]